MKVLLWAGGTGWSRGVSGGEDTRFRVDRFTWCTCFVRAVSWRRGRGRCRRGLFVVVGDGEWLVKATIRVNEIK